jgi:WXG100 family type VII secretion target
MTTLHMETDVARSTQQALSTKQQSISSDLSTITGSVSNLRSNWQGNSASQFFQEYEQWNSAMGKMLEELLKMSTRLQAEVDQWEQTASRLG